MANWDKRFMDLAKLVATWSKDRHTQVGAVIVSQDNTILSVGYNGFPRGSNDEIDSRHERPAKYFYTEHAERNAIYNAVRSGVCLKDSKIYLPWFPCVDCARAIINSGIKDVVAIIPDWNHPRWGEQMKISEELFLECGVKIKWFEPFGS
jgi:dCMP deaminase